MGRTMKKDINNVESFEEDALLKRRINTKVSIIIPVYNTEEYIEKNLNSLVNQTLREIEIIVVNDGSTDNSMTIVEEFAARDSRIKIINQRNLKQGAARNNGIKIAGGEYIGFVDSDDWVDLDYYERLYNTAKKYNSDLALATNVRIGNGQTKKRIHITKEDFITDLQKKMDICHQWKDGCPTNKLYRRSFLETNNIVFPEGVSCEDKIFTTKSVYYANGIATVPNLYYYYFRNPNSTVKERNKKTNSNDKENARREVLNFLKSKKAAIRDKDFWAVKKDYRLFGLTLYRIKESLHTEKHLLFSMIPVCEQTEKQYA